MPDLSGIDAGIVCWCGYSVAFILIPGGCSLHRMKN